MIRIWGLRGFVVERFVVVGNVGNYVRGIVVGIIRNNVGGFVVMVIVANLGGTGKGLNYSLVPIMNCLQLVSA